MFGKCDGRGVDEDLDLYGWRHNEGVMRAKANSGKRGNAKRVKERLDWRTEILICKKCTLSMVEYVSREMFCGKNNEK